MKTRIMLNEVELASRDSYAEAQSFLNFAKTDPELGLKSTDVLEIHTDDSTREEGIKFYKESLKKRKQRVDVLSVLAAKATRAGLTELYNDLVSTNAMQKILEVWRNGGDTAWAIVEMKKISGSVKVALDTQVGSDIENTLFKEIKRAMLSVSD